MKNSIQFPTQFLTIFLNDWSNTQDQNSKHWKIKRNYSEMYWNSGKIKYVFFVERETLFDSAVAD